MDLAQWLILEVREYFSKGEFDVLSSTALSRINLT